MRTEEELIKIFSKNLRMRTFRSGKSLWDVSKEVGITYRTLYGYAKGERLPSGYYLYLIANHFGCSMDEMLEE